MARRLRPAVLLASALAAASLVTWILGSRDLASYLATLGILVAVLSLHDR